MNRKIDEQSPIDEIGGGYQASQILLTANRLGIFTVLGSASMNVDELTSILRTERRATRILCDALTALGLLDKQAEQYRNSVSALEYLLPESPLSKQALLLHHACLYERWGKLYDTVLSGCPVSKSTGDSHLAEDEHAFARAMADRARLSAQQLVELVDLSGARKMLDLGGGPGLYAIAFVQKYPGLRAVVFDREKTLEAARMNIEQSGLAERISVSPGDLFTDPLGDGYDFILVSNVIHSYSHEQNYELVRNCARALAPQGRLCIKDFILDPERTSPKWAALFAVNMLVNTDAGDCYTVKEVEAWLTQTGLALDSIIIQTPQTKLIIGRK